MSIHIHILKTPCIFSNKMSTELQRTLKPLTQACHLAREPWSEESLLPGLRFITRGCNGFFFSIFMTNQNILWPPIDNLISQNNKSSGFTSFKIHAYPYPNGTLSV